MPTCPICQTSLKSVPQRTGVYHHCVNCDGRALTISQLRRISGDRFSTRMLRLIPLSRKRSSHACPFCTQPMWLIELPEPKLELDACRACNLVWFDAPSYETLPEGAAETLHAITAEATEILAIQRLKEQKQREEAEQKRNRKRKSPRSTDDATAG
jgi:Zn-finger nucleic acid-binding protein